LFAPITSDADELKPTRDAFLNEVFDARPTAVTPKFDGYTPGSYAFSKLGLLKELIIERRKRKVDLVAAIIDGPLSPLRTYDVTVFIREGDKIRANALLFAHERITGKATGFITPSQLEKLVSGISVNGIAKRGLPKNKDGEFSGDYGYHLLVATWSKDGKEMTILFGDLLLEQKKLDEFCKLYEDARKNLKRTYPEKDE
jgi:hypothetical protein